MGKVVTDLEIKYIIPMDYNSGLIMISYTDQKLAEYWNKFINQGPEKLEEELLRQLKLLFPKKKIPKTTFLKSHYWANGMVALFTAHDGFHASPMNIAFTCLIFRDEDCPFSNP